MVVTSESFVPSPTITFLGGPYDGFVAEPDIEPSTDLDFPPYIRPEDATSLYIRMCTCHLPDWIVTPPHMDVFDAVYVWLPYLDTTEGEGDIPVEPEPEPQLLR